MKTTIDISDSLLAEAKALAREQNVTLRCLTEEGLRRIIEDRRQRKSHRIKPVTFQGRGLSEEFRGASWERIRDEAYEGRGS
jgi:thiamine monophosphate kinase